MMTEVAELFHVKLQKIKARLGSISPSRMNEFPISVQKLLEEDFPEVIEEYEVLSGKKPRLHKAPALGET